MCLPEHPSEDFDVVWRAMPQKWAGVYAWTLQTYLQLRALGFPCELVDALPDEGVVVAHRSCLPVELRPGPKQLVVCLKSDKKRHPFAQLHIVQNPSDKILREAEWGGWYMPHWPQPGLVPRDPARGERFENIVYMGSENNLAEELRDGRIEAEFDRCGLIWKRIERSDGWHDYRKIDAIVAVRSFTRAGYFAKPATKLFNAWHAGVPAILGCESAYLAERRGELDYIEVRSVPEVRCAIQKLRDDRDLRGKMVENGKARAEETSAAVLVERWRSLLEKDVVPAYHRWRALPSWGKKLFLAKRSLRSRVDRLRARLKRYVGRRGRG
jgi:hypothetical protein